MEADLELERLKRKRLAQLQKARAAKEQSVGSEQPKLNPKKALEGVFIERAWEVYEATERQYPQIAGRILAELADLVKAGRLRGKITGEQLYSLLRQIGLNVRLETKIQVVEHGELKPLAERLRGA